MGENLYELLHQCTVRLRLVDSHSDNSADFCKQGTGFFVASGLILTCAHVVESTTCKHAQHWIEVCWEQHTSQPQKVERIEGADLALVHIEPFPDHPCVQLDDAYEPSDDLYSYGYTLDHPDGDSIMVKAEGWTRSKIENLLKLKDGQIAPGSSGAPLLNKRTGKVCGVIVETRGRNTNLGGRAIWTEAIWQKLPVLKAQQQAFHQADQRWSTSLEAFLSQHSPKEEASLLGPGDLAKAEALYRKQVVDAYRHLNLFGLGELGRFLDEVPLEAIFVHLHLRVEREVEKEPHPQQSEKRKGASQTRERVFEFQDITLAQALSKPLLLVGNPGSGKSTLLHWLAVTFAQGRQSESDRIGTEAAKDRLPVVVELGHLEKSYLQDEEGDSPNWFTFLPDLISRRQDFYGVPAGLLQQALRDGRCLLLFDGLDEIANPQARLRLARSLADFQRLAPGNQLVIGSRPTGLSDSEVALSPSFQHCEIQPFTSEDLQRFFLSWYRLDHTLSLEMQKHAADALYQQVAALPGTQRLATTPLLATILFLLWRKEGRLPERRVDLYARCCRVLLEQWEHAHDIRYQNITVQLRWDQQLRLLEYVAYFLHQHEQRIDAAESDLIEVLAQGLVEEKIYADKVTARWKAASFLELLALRSALLQYRGIEQGKKHYGFLHLTFQEYLAARFLADQPNYTDLVMRHLHEGWWQEVHVLAIGYLGSSTQHVSKAVILLNKILQRYPSPPWWLRSSRVPLLRFIQPGKWFPGVQLERRLAWLLKRERMFTLRAVAECDPDQLSPEVQAAFIKQTQRLVRDMLIDKAYYPLLGNWLVNSVSYLPLWMCWVCLVGLVQALHHPDEDVRWRAAESLGKLGTESEAAVLALVQALHHPDEDVRWSAATSLGKLGIESEAAVLALVEALHHPDEDVRWRAAESLGKVGIESETAVLALVQALHDPDEDVRWRAAESLGKLGTESETAVLALVQALHDPSWDVRRSAATSLGQTEITEISQQRRVLVALNQCMYDWDDVRSSALQSLHRLLDNRAFPGSR